MTALGSAIDFLKDFGFFDVILPFLLVFSILFGILEKTKVFGVEDCRRGIGEAQALQPGDRQERRVGHALHANPSGDLTPCHRVVTKDGKLSESYAFGGSIEQYAKLNEEGITFLDRTHVNLSKHLFRYP